MVFVNLHAFEPVLVSGWVVVPLVAVVNSIAVTISPQEILFPSLCVYRLTISAVFNVPDWSLLWLFSNHTRLEVVRFCDVARRLAPRLLILRVCCALQVLNDLIKPWWLSFLKTVLHSQLIHSRWFSSNLVFYYCWQLSQTEIHSAGELLLIVATEPVFKISACRGFQELSYW